MNGKIFERRSRGRGLRALLMLLMVGVLAGCGGSRTFSPLTLYPEVETEPAIPSALAKPAGTLADSVLTGGSGPHNIARVGAGIYVIRANDGLVANFGWRGDALFEIDALALPTSGTEQIVADEYDVYVADPSGDFVRLIDADPLELDGSLDVDLDAGNLAQPYGVGMLRANFLVRLFVGCLDGRVSMFDNGTLTGRTPPGAEPATYIATRQGSTLADSRVFVLRMGGSLSVEVLDGTGASLEGVPLGGSFTDAMIWHDDARGLLVVSAQDGFTSGTDDYLILFNSDTLAEIGRVSVGADRAPWSIAADSEGRLYVTCRNPGQVLVTNVDRTAIENSIDIEGTPQHLLYYDHHIFVTDSDRNQLCVYRAYDQ